MAEGYLTERWARRFLQSLFSRYIVLFVGYSYRDAVMNYLTRGLPPESEQSSRYALAQAGHAERWAYLGITPLEYELDATAENTHCHLMEAVSEWAKIANSGVLEREERIKKSVEAPVPLDADTQDYIESSFQELATARFFTRYAIGLDWLHWIEDKEPFARIFRSDVMPTDVDWELATWFARVFVCKHTDNALALIRRKRMSITGVLWAVVAQSFHTEKPSSEVVRKWVPLLIRHRTPPYGGDFLEYTLYRSQYPDDLNSALLLFEYLTKPEIILEERWWLDENDKADERGDVALTTEGDDPWLPGAWTNLFRPHLGTIANKLIWIVTSHLQHAYLLLEAYEEIHPTWDTLSSRRGLLETTAQGSPPKGVGILVDVARDILEWAIVNRPDTADQLIRLWFYSDCRLLKRLALFGIGKAQHWQAEAKIKWILEHKLLYAPGFKHEVFLVLEGAYSQTSPDLRAEVIVQATGGPELAASDPNVQAYEEYDLIAWLAKNAPECPTTEATLAEILKKNPDFSPRERPDMDAWIGPVTTGWQSPRTSEEVLAKPPEEQVGYFLEFEPKDYIQMTIACYALALLVTVAAASRWAENGARRRAVLPRLIN